jgi:hypothetical protein
LVALVVVVVVVLIELNSRIRMTANSKWSITLKNQ